MQINDPLDAAIARVDADEGVAQNVISVLEGCSAAGIPMVSAAAKLIGLVTHTRQENVSYLLDVVISELRRVRLQVEELSDEHQHFIEEELRRLLTEAAARAGETASRPRIQRMAIIVVNTIVHGSSERIDRADEMLRVSVSLADDDVDVLAHIYSVLFVPLGQFGFLPDQNVINQTWKTLEKLPGFISSRTYGICAKLQSLGLIVQVEKIPTMLGLSSIPYGLLTNGREYIEAIGRNYTATIIDPS